MPAKDPLPEMDEATLLRLQGEGFERLRVELGVKITDEIAAQVEAEWPKDEPKDGIRRNE